MHRSLWQIFKVTRKLRFYKSSRRNKHVSITLLIAPLKTPPPLKLFGVNRSCYDPKQCDMRSEQLTSRTLWPSCTCSEATTSLHKAMCCWYRRHRLSSPFGSRRSKTSGSRTAGRFNVPRIIGRNMGTLWWAVTIPVGVTNKTASVPCFKQLHILNITYLL